MTGYIVTTKRPIYSGVIQGGVDHASRVEVDTLDEARRKGQLAAMDAMSPRQHEAWSPVLDAFDDLTESGGSITLPDGTTITVERKDD